MMTKLIIMCSYSIMTRCWALNAKDRPRFKELRSTIDRALQKAAGYLELSMVLMPSESDNSG